MFGSRVTLVGDAAHAHGGAFAAGGSLALDDSLALGLAFKHVFNSPTGQEYSTGNVEKALGLYGKTRQPHTTRLLHIVHNQIEQRASACKSFEEEDTKLLARMRNRPDTAWLSEHDVEAAFKAVLEAEEQLEQKTKLEERGKSNGPVGRVIELQKSKF